MNGLSTPAIIIGAYCSSGRGGHFLQPAAAHELVREGIPVPTDFSREDKRRRVYPGADWFPKLPGQGFPGYRKEKNGG